MEIYAKLIPVNTAMITTVTYDSEGNRVERIIYIEELKDGHVDLIVRGENCLPKRLGDKMFW